MTETQTAQKRAGKKAKVAKPVKHSTLVHEVLLKYMMHEWTAFAAGKDAPYDIIARGTNRLHFVKVTAPDADFQGLTRNNFIQNAFSNNAIPVVATVTMLPRVSISFEDINLGARVIIGGARRPPKVEPADPVEAVPPQ